MKYIKVKTKDRIARIIIARPDVRNAFDDALIREMLSVWKSLEENRDVRVMVLSSEGEVFSAGADLKWMKRMADYSFEDNLEDADTLFECVMRLSTLPFPTICRIQGPVFGGGLGLVAACDIAISSSTAQFAFTEARLGLAPAVVSPFIARKMMPGTLRELFLTGRRFDADEALRSGLINEVSEPDKLDESVDNCIKRILACSPNALSDIKLLLEKLPFQDLESARPYTSRLIAQLRESEEGQEGINAFFDRRKPEWVK